MKEATPVQLSTLTLRMASASPAWQQQQQQLYQQPKWQQQ
jgi:hypothetical protein